MIDTLTNQEGWKFIFTGANQDAIKTGSSPESITQTLDLHNVTNCTCGKEKRYCKGCFCDVTETMWCYCGEQPLTKESTYTDDDLKRMNV